jgi:hypothetical protein
MFCFFFWVKFTIIIKINFFWSILFRICLNNMPLEIIYLKRNYIFLCRFYTFRIIFNIHENLKIVIRFINIYYLLNLFLRRLNLLTFFNFVQILIKPRIFLFLKRIYLNALLILLLILLLLT